jgi:hypothetical protein
MFATCLFCHSSLGRNDVVEPFPVGRRLAFDAAKGRLWVVCLHCGQWNLTPIEERWEAIEECERRFRPTKLRVSTEHVGLARLKEGLELVRIGEPLRPEFAAWRYGDQLGRRRRRALLAAGVVGIAAAGAIVGGVATGVFAGIPAALWVQLHGIPKWAYAQRVVARIPAGRRHAFTVRGKHLAGARLVPDAASDAWVLRLAHDGGERTFTGRMGVRAASHLLAGMNGFGATRLQVGEAVEMMEAVGDPLRYFTHVARRARELGNLSLARLPHEVRLALEMSAHEEAESRAMQGELAELEAAWRDAEEVAAIADDMFLPKSVDDFLRRHRPRAG